MISFAAGGLLGDVFFHTLPHMSHSHGVEEHSHDIHDHHHDHDHGHDHGHDHVHEHHAHDHGHGHAHSEADMQKNLIIIVGIMAFFLLEKVTASLLGGH